MGSGPLSFRDTALDRNTVILAEPRASPIEGTGMSDPGANAHCHVGAAHFAAAGGHGVACRPFS
jgi:hypothetical protein